MNRITAVFTALSLSLGLQACSTVSLEATHVSHPLRGPPFGPTTEEDSLDVLQITGRKEFGNRVYIQQSLGYRYVDGGFYGDDFIYTGTIGVKILGD